MWYIHQDFLQPMEDAMPWNQATQEEYKRNQQELETTLTDGEWLLIEPLLPAPSPKSRPRTTDQGRTSAASLGASGPSGIQRNSVHSWNRMPMAAATSLFPPFYYCKDGLFGSVLLL